ncbi:unnamed protein product [Cylicocyclus nassatus]|uniref:Uncharacterized protein n=1 Tax=Cylicocyclus nassatus TaxID=53992 RepID=A0AA36DL75_CYLNA|nr:unnamed protein product [Cylicocyclus nassatus]
MEMQLNFLAVKNYHRTTSVATPAFIVRRRGSKRIFRVKYENEILTAPDSSGDVCISVIEGSDPGRWKKVEIYVQ